MEYIYIFCRVGGEGHEKEQVYCVAFLVFCFFCLLSPSMFDLSRLQYASWNLFTSLE